VRSAKHDIEEGEEGCCKSEEKKKRKKKRKQIVKGEKTMWMVRSRVRW